ncbi:MAG: hypothetical protein IKU45_03945, partial [Clostridia bacterium]|nr:hypothetical protein [Clostridia bacterium]
GSGAKLLTVCACSRKRESVFSKRHIRSGETPETPQGVALKPTRFLKKAGQKLYNKFGRAILFS